MKKNWNEKNPTEQLKEMFVDIVQQKRIDLGQHPAKRAVFLKPHGIAHGYFEICEDLPADMQVGVFALKKLDAWVRFSSDTQPSSPDLKTTCGIAIKLFGVEGEKLLGNGKTQDFILQNHDVFFVDNAQDMANFTKAGVVDLDYDIYLDKHPKTKQILDDMAKVVASSLTTEYWSGLPYAFGDKRFVKYKLSPIHQPEGEPFDSADYLALDLQSRLRRGGASFKFLVQFRTNPKTMPLDEATVRWSEEESAPIHVATLHLPQQDISELGQAAYGENLAYNPWHSLQAHEPQGSIAQARKVVYQASAEKRHEANGIPTQEPEKPYQTKTMHKEDEEDNTILTAAIYPPIGVCRVGNSEKEYFIGPEVPEPLAEKVGFYRDSVGAIKRQAARFRVYGLNAKGNVVKELTADEAKITWQVHLANQKSAWYQFQMALDVPESAQADPSCLRNPQVADRKKLIIEGGKQNIAGKNKKSKAFKGKFMKDDVYLGELHTDDAGRLIVLGGHGKAGSYDDTVAVTFANNDGWYDDTSDGPVTAEVEYKGKKLAVKPAWVITAPPNYAPLQKSVRTMWDLMRDLAITNKQLPQPERPSFMHDILPLFQRMHRLQWVNAGFAAGFGFGGAFDYTTAEWIEKLSSSLPAYREIRKNIANHFRNFDIDSWSPAPFPWLYGDAMNVPAAKTPRQHVTLTNTQLHFLQQWAEGDFITDYNPDAEPYRKLEDVPVAEQPDTLTKAAMEFCLADAFHPGCEMTWPMRLIGLYAEAFRLKHAPAGWIEPSLGAILTPDSLGYLKFGQVAGGITRWMAIPWHTDTASCRSGYDKSYDPYLPAFWPARVPNQVLAEEEYEVVMDTQNELGKRLEAFAKRTDWDTPLDLTQGYVHQINYMIDNFGEMYIVEEREGLPDDPNFPAMMEVASTKPKVIKSRGLESDSAEVKTKKSYIERENDIYDLTQIDKVRRYKS